MANEIPTLGELESRVLQLVWQYQPCAERHISDIVQAERDVARTTVLKTMQRLEAKGLLQRDGARPAQYTATVEQQRVLPELVRRFVDGALGGSAEPLVAYLAGQNKLSAKDIQLLKKIAGKIDS